MDLRRETLESFDGVELYSMSMHTNAPKAAVLFLHGIGEASDMYEAEMKLLKRDQYSVYSLDLRGHGKSPGVRNLWYSYEDTFEDLDIMIARIRERHGLDVPVYLLGYGFGGLVAASYIAAEKQTIDGLIFCGSTPRAKLNLLEERFKSSISLMMPGHSVNFEDNVSSKVPIRTIVEIDRLSQSVSRLAPDLSVPLLYIKWGDRDDVLDGFYRKSSSRLKEHLCIDSQLRNNQRVETIETVNLWLNDRLNKTYLSELV